MWPVSFASSNRFGLITVAVKRSPMRESLLESVSLMRALRSVPTATSGATVVRLTGVRRLRVGFLVCEARLAANGAVAFENVSRRSLAHDDVLQTHQAIEQRFRTRGATGNVNIHGNTTIDALHRRIGIEWSTGRSTRAHCDGPLRLRHLIVNAAHDWSHLQSHCARNDDQIAWPRTRPEHARTEPVDVEPSGDRRDHLDRATREPERHGPQR